MALKSQPSQARAVGAFNPTAPQPGFLQPLLVGIGGDNRTYVQALQSPDRITGFAEVAWPDRDFVQLLDEPLLKAGGPALWAFHFPGEVPLVDFWQGFRASLGARINDPELATHPLLQFDIVDTLGLEEAKPDVFTKAYRAYAAMGSDAANRWRDRAILEPAIARCFAKFDIRRQIAGGARQVREQAGEEFSWLRARTVTGRIEVQADGLDARQERAVQQAYDELALQLPELFPRNADVVFRASQPRPTHSRPRLSDIKVVLVGRLGQGGVQHSQWADREIEVVDATHFQVQSQSQAPSPITIFLGTQADWRSLVEIGQDIDPQSGLIITLSTSASPLIRDLEFQAETGLCTLSFFAPYLTSTFGARDPVQPLEPILNVLLTELRSAGRQALRHVFPRQHNVMMREPVASGQTPLEISCRLGARALRAGAVLDGPARMYMLGSVPSTGETVANGLSTLFVVNELSQLNIVARRSAVILLVERLSRFDPEMRVMQQRQGVLRLLQMMGWTIFQETEHGCQIGGPDRQFSVFVAEDTTEVPPENPGAPAPGLTRAPLLIVHLFPRRDTLLTGNRGQYFHAAIEDIALMVPESPWVWAIVKRQLFEGNPRQSQAALRLSAALVVEAIEQRRIIDPSSADVDWSRVHELLLRADCERFVRFLYEKAVRGRLSLALQSETLSREIVIDLYIEDNGPMIQATIEDRLPFK